MPVRPFYVVFCICLSCALCKHTIETEAECRHSLAKTAAICRAEKRQFSITDFVHGSNISSNISRASPLFDEGAFLALNHSYPGLKPLHSQHNMYVIDDFISDADRRSIIESLHEFSDSSAQPGATTFRSQLSFLQQAQTNCDAQIRRNGNCANMIVRKSEKAKLETATIHLLKKVVTKIAHLLPGLMDGSHCFEPMMITRYEPGDFYSRHLDGRRATVLIFLGSDLGNGNATMGGCTHFPEIDLRVQPYPGRAMVFFPTYAHGQVKPEMVHSAEEVMQGQKYIIQQWIDLPEQYFEVLKNVGVQPDDMKRLVRRSCDTSLVPALDKRITDFKHHIEPLEGQRR